MSTDIQEDNTKRFKNEVKEEIPSRRLVLRGALAIGCGLLLPASLLGCDSRKGKDDIGAAPSDNPDIGAAPGGASDAGTDSSAPAAAKVSQASVQYQTQPKGDQKCSGCMHFIADSNTCKLVEGQISSEGWCSLWVKQT